MVTDIISQAQNIILQALNIISQAQNIISQAQNIISQAQNVILQAQNLSLELQAHGCKTQHMPWADGTPCGEGKQITLQRISQNHPLPMKMINIMQASGACAASVSQRSRGQGKHFKVTGEVDILLLLLLLSNRLEHPFIKSSAFGKKCPRVPVCQKLFRQCPNRWGDFYRGGSLHMVFFFSSRLDFS